MTNNIKRLLEILELKPSRLKGFYSKTYVYQGKKYTLGLRDCFVQNNKIEPKNLFFTFKKDTGEYIIMGLNSFYEYIQKSKIFRAKLNKIIMATLELGNV